VKIQRLETRGEWSSRCLAIAAGIAWLGLGLQFYFTLQTSLARGLAPAIVIVRYFSYFTILANLLAALALTFASGSATVSVGRFFAKALVQAGIAVDIALVFLGYNLLLRHVWNPQGLERLADEVLHVATPVLYVASVSAGPSIPGSRLARSHSRLDSWPRPGPRVNSSFPDGDVGGTH
jgi:hypothetical protein